MSPGWGGLAARELLRRWPLVLVALVAVGLGAVGAAALLGNGGEDHPVPAGASAAPAPPGEEFDGCALVTREHAGKILGETPRESPRSAEQFTTASCTWEVVGARSRSLQFSAYRGHELYGGELFEDDPDYQAVEGVGDDAFFMEPLGVQLQFLEGEYAVLISVNGLDEKPPLDRDEVKRQLVTLGKQIASKLD